MGLLFGEGGRIGLLLKYRGSARKILSLSKKDPLLLTSKLLKILHICLLFRIIGVSYSELPRHLLIYHVGLAHVDL